MLNKIKYSFLKNHLKKPIYLIFFVTSKCNSKCRHCFFSKELNNKIKDLSVEEIDRFSKEIGKLLWLDFSGGEPFLRTDLFEIYKIFIKNNKVDTISIPTNGILTEKIYSDVVKMLEYDKVKSLTVSLSLEGTEAIHNKIRGVNCYKNVIRTYEKLAPLKKKYKQLSIMVSTVITNKNFKILRDFHKELKRLMPELDFHNFEIMRGNPKDKNYNAPSINELRKLKSTIFNIWDDYDHYKSKLQARIAKKTKKILYDNYLNIMKTKKQPWPCLAGKVHCVVDYKGDVFFCEMLAKIGSLREKSFTEIWNSKEANNMRRFIKERKCSCTHSCFQITNLIFNQFYWPKLLF